MIDVSTSATGARITVSEDLDLASRESADAVARRLALLERPAITVDLCRMDFMDSTGAAWLISLAGQSIQRDGTISLLGASARDLFVLQVCGALDLFDVNHRHQCPDATHATA
ncbi:STAS domain-containing protein [Ruania halotolerans]|uniref:STAS domain-containing protein n=1 Tax=Ruania halotolerans TaxID=2897773 RepID=UPI001E5BE59A|nr:STAS domain-containing protein [Ruania halotolerans]UFU06045.1 STAS domain-containing protein [Ruania halotolerans]